jgi:hypothetical protein
MFMSKIVQALNVNVGLPCGLLLAERMNLPPVDTGATGMVTSAVTVVTNIAKLPILDVLVETNCVLHIVIDKTLPPVKIGGRVSCYIMSN